jgi:arylsulfatase A-like enzyme
VRLLPALGTPEPARLAQQTRPAVLLRSGESRSTSARLPGGGRLVFAFGVGPRAPLGGFLEFSVRVGGAEAFRKRISAKRRQWWPVSLPVPAGRSVAIEFRGDHVKADGTLLPEAPARGAPWIAVGSPRVYAGTSPRRVLVWISIDTLRADHLGAYGHGRPTSPVFDRLAASGTLFDHAVAPASWTLPSLASQFGSRYPVFHRAVDESSRRDARGPTVFEVLAREGFTVLGATANEFVSHHFGLADGFDALWFTGGRADELNALVREGLGDWGGGDLALFVHYMDPHYHYDPPAPYDSAFLPGARARVGTRELEEIGASDVESVRALYDGEVAYTDAQVGALLEMLRERTLLDRAVVVFSADHGEEFLDHGGWKHGRTLYEEMLRVPLVVRVPGVPPRRIAQVVSLVDVAPTILDAFGIAAPAAFQGRSLLPLARGGRSTDVPVYAETEHYRADGHRVAVRHGTLKYVAAAERGGGDVAVLSEELYDLAGDPGELQPLARSAARDRMRQYAIGLLSRGRAEAPPAVRQELPADLQERLRALGYLR